MRVDLDTTKLIPSLRFYKIGLFLNQILVYIDY